MWHGELAPEVELLLRLGQAERDRDWSTVEKILSAAVEESGLPGLPKMGKPCASLSDQIARDDLVWSLMHRARMELSYHEYFNKDPFDDPEYQYKRFVMLWSSFR